MHPMEFSEAYPYFGAAMIAVLLYVVLRKRIRGHSVAWDVIIFASVITGVAISIAIT